MEVTHPQRRASSPRQTICSLYSNQIRMALSQASVRSTARENVLVSVVSRRLSFIF